MSFDWKNFIILAEKLIYCGDEASLRSGISRAYYALFCIARNKAGLKNYNKSDVHRKVIDYYQSSNDNREKFVGRILDGLRRERNSADYNENKIVSLKLAKRVLLKANNALDKLGS